MTPTQTTTAERETSIRRGVEVLLSLAGEESLISGGLGVTQISELLGREKSQVSRALKALSEYGLVERTESSAYRLGWKLFAVAQLAGDSRLLAAAAPRVRRLALGIGERAHLSVLQGTDALTIVSQAAPRSVQATGWAGRVTPAYCTSAGRAMLLDWDEGDILSAFAEVPFIARGPRTAASPRALLAAVRTAVELGYVVVDEEFEPELVGLAVPVRDRRRTIIASLNVSAPRYRFLERVPEVARELQAMAAEIARELDAPPDEGLGSGDLSLR
ncbi:MAG: IclR family transcriptional regulator [Solirubrobacterales bacterium]|nr:IclR family transcriptional regulator [Solirubrobacterales bacterium]